MGFSVARTLALGSLFLVSPARAALPQWCGRALEITASHPAIFAGCSSGQCTRNLRRLLATLDTPDGKKLGFDPGMATMFFLRRTEELRGTRFWASHWRTPTGPGREDPLHHTIMALAYGDGHIVDLDFGKGHETPTVAEYFPIMFPSEIGGLAIGEMPAADFMAVYPVLDPRDESPL